MTNEQPIDLIQAGSLMRTIEELSGPGKSSRQRRIVLATLHFAMSFNDEDRAFIRRWLSGMSPREACL